jgi:predicted nucleic acid-binding protein
MIYLDTSAAVKALIREAETPAIRALFDSGADLISSRLLAVELHAVVDRRGLRATDARALLERVAQVSLSDDIAQRAIDLRSGLRTLDALHLATAVSLGPVVASFLSFDDELNTASLKHGIPLHALGGT